MQLLADISDEQVYLVQFFGRQAPSDRKSGGYAVPCTEKPKNPLKLLASIHLKMYSMRLMYDTKGW